MSYPQPIVRKYYRLPAIHWLAIYLTAGFITGSTCTAFLVAITRPTVVRHEVCAVDPKELVDELHWSFVLGGAK
jgi:hypothetical protein